MMSPRLQPCVSGKARTGFTLIELLVVVAIIALLISILLPSLNRAREQVKATVCMANLRSMGQAFTMYAEEFKGVWPAAVDSLGTQNRWPVPFHQAGIISAELNQYDENGTLLIEGGQSVFLCPTEKADRTIYDWNEDGKVVDRVEVGGSYAYTEEVHRDGEELDRGNLSRPPYLRPVDQCRRPSEVFMVMENFRPLEDDGDRGWRYNRGIHVGDNRTAFFFGYRQLNGTVVQPSPTIDQYKIIGGRHNGYTNALCVDTHVEKRKPEEVAYNDVSWDRWADPDSLPPGGF